MSPDLHESVVGQPSFRLFVPFGIVLYIVFIVLSCASL